MIQETVSPAGTPEFTSEGESYTLRWATGIEAVVERIAEHKDEITAEVTISSSRIPRPGHVHSARLNLMSTQTRKALASACESREPNLDWPMMIEQLCVLTRERYRNGEPTIDIREWTDPPGSRWVLEPYVEAGGPTILFADGGTGKSMLATAIAVSIASGQAVVGKVHIASCPVLYLDWETDASTLNERVRAICAGAGINVLSVPIHYRKSAASIPEAAPEIRRQIQKLGVGFVVIDSLGAARGGEPESADMTIRTFNAARTLGVPWLGVDHVTKAAGNDSTRPFGSTYTHNLARLTWGMDKSQEAGAKEVSVALTNHKRNNGHKIPTIGYKITYEEMDEEMLGSVVFKPERVVDGALSSRASLKDRILAELKAGPVSGWQVIAENLGADKEQVRKRVDDLEKSSKIVRFPDKSIALRYSD